MSALAVDTTPRTLPPTPHIAVGADSTVTDLLEAHAGEAVEAFKLHQRHALPTRSDGGLALCGNETLLHRRVLLRTALSHRPLLYAQATVVVDRLPRGFVDALLHTDKPIGTLLRDFGIESRRVGLATGTEAAGPCASHLGLDADDTVITRIYCIVIRRRPAIAITERFPAGAFADTVPA